MSNLFDEKFVGYAVNHVNNDSYDAMLSILKYEAHIDWPIKVILNTYAHSKMVVVGLNNQDKKENDTIAFPKTLDNAREFRLALIELLSTVKKSS
jgi:hypothetical protein